MPSPRLKALARAETRLRQSAELRSRRLVVLPKEACVQAEALRGWLYLDQLEARGVPMTHAQIAASLGMTREGVRLIEIRALAKLRAALGIDLG